MGGTFSPPHIGHLMMAKASLISLNLDEVIFIPCGNPPHKNIENVWSAGCRFDMTKLLVKNEEKMSVSDIEIKSEDKSYTAKTLSILKNTNPDTLFYFIVGADSLCYMDKWKTPELIFKNAEIIAIDREGYDDKMIDDYIKFLTDKYGAVVHKIFMEKVDISSSQLRKMIADNKDISIYTNKEIYGYILENINEF